MYPFAFKGKLIQYIGPRIQRSEKPPVTFDYRDSKINYFGKMFKQRNRYYKKLMKRGGELKKQSQIPVCYVKIYSHIAQ